MAAEQPLTFAELYKGTHQFLFANLKAFAVVCFLPLIFMAVLDYLSLESMLDVAAEMLGPNPLAALQEGGQATLQAFSDAVAERSALFGGLALLPIIVFSVGWQRFVLLGAAAAPRLLPALNKTHLMYFLYSLAIGVAVVVLVLPFGLIGAAVSSQIMPLFILLGLFPALFVATRLSLVLPAAAVSAQGFGLEQSWKASKGQVLRLLGANFLAVLPPLVLAALLAYGLQEDLGYLLIQGVGFGSVLLANVLMSLCSLLAAALQVAVNAHAFRRLTGWQP